MIDDGVSLLLTEVLNISFALIPLQMSDIQLPPAPDGLKREQRDLLSVEPIDHSGLSVLMPLRIASYCLRGWWQAN